MALFKRRNQQDVPTEIQEYYQAENRERAGVAWLLAIVTLLVTAAVILGLFFGGRYVYRKLVHHNQPAPVAQPLTKGNQNKPQPAPAPAPTSTNPPSPVPNASTPPPAPSPSSGGQVSPNAATTTTPSTPSSQLTNTGPGDTLATFMIAVVIGIGLYELRLRYGTKSR